MLIDKNKHTQRGIALITTIILTSIMLTSVVLVSKEMVDEVRNSTRIDNSLIAYYAAEAGLEEAMLEWKYDHDVEISEENDNDPGVDVTSTSNSTPRTVDITNDITIPNTTTKEYTNSYYELKMWNKVPCIVTTGDLNAFGCATIAPLKADDVYQISIDNIGTNNLTLDFIPRANPNPDEFGNGYRVELTVLDENGNIINSAKSFRCPLYTTQTLSYNSTTLSGSSGKRIIRIKPWYVQYSSSPNCDKNPTNGATNLPISPDFPYIHLKVNYPLFTNRPLISGPVSYIESVGFYGGVQRKIIASIDRSSGNITSILDYSIYSGSDLIK